MRNPLRELLAAPPQIVGKNAAVKLMLEKYDKLPPKREPVVGNRASSSPA